MFDFVMAVASIVLIDLVLSGDNALVIGAAASGLPPRQRWWAILLGGGGAVVLRVLFTVIVSLLLQLPLLQALGGLLLLIIAIRLLMDRGGGTQEGAHSEQVQTHPEGGISASSVRQSRGLVGALVTVLVADVTMSLDNVLAVGALALGDLPLLAVGIMLSIVIVLLGSALVAMLIRRLPWLLDVAALVLGWTAARMLLDDIRLGPVFDGLAWTQWAIPVAMLGIVVVADILLRLGAEQKKR